MPNDNQFVPRVSYRIRRKSDLKYFGFRRFNESHDPTTFGVYWYGNPEYVSDTGHVVRADSFNGAFALIQNFECLKDQHDLEIVKFEYHIEETPVWTNSNPDTQYLIRHKRTGLYFGYTGRRVNELSIDPVVHWYDSVDHEDTDDDWIARYPSKEEADRALRCNSDLVGLEDLEVIVHKPSEH